VTRPPLTQAVGVTPDEVARLGYLFSSKDLRSVQSKLTAAASELRNLANGRQRGGGLVASLGALLTPEQCHLLLEAAKLVESVGSAVTHAKEKRVRSEADAKRRQDARRIQAKQVVARTYPLPDETDEQRLDIVKAALILNRAGQHRPNYSPPQFNAHLRSLIEVAPRLFGGMTLTQHRTCALSSVRLEMIEELSHHLAYDDGSTVDERLQALQQKVAEAVAQAVLTADERETLRQWKEALLPNDAQGAAS
jgi:hypothetical protein